MQKWIYILMSLLFIQTSFAFNHQHTIWTKILKKYLIVEKSQSLVNYKGLKKSDSDFELFNAYLKELSDLSQDEFNEFNEDQKLAFLINAYNAFTIKLIITHYPVDSIKDIGSFFTSPWKKKFFNLFGKKMHLDGIEHGMIRKNFNEPRIHFAVNCASLGCPSLAQEAFVADQIDHQLERATSHFLTDKTKNRIDFKNINLEISKIFDWYGEDFINKFGSVQKFIAPYLSIDPSIQEKIKSNKFSIVYLKYSWKLNETN